MLAAALSDHSVTVLAALALQLIQLFVSSWNARKAHAIRSEQKHLKAALESNRRKPRKAVKENG